MKPLSSAAVVLVSWAGMLGCLALARAIDPTLFELGDFPSFWSAAVVAGGGGNPYDLDQIMPILRSEFGWKTIDLAAGFWNPPFCLPLYLPLRLFDPWTARWLWTAVQLGAILVAGVVLWREYGGSAARSGVAIVVTLAFYGQYWSIRLAHPHGLALLGLAGFLHFTRRDRPAAAGVCAALTALKPHLLLVFALWLILGATRRQGLIVVLAGGLILLAGLGVAEAFTPGITSHYLDTIVRPSGTNHLARTDMVSGAPGYHLRTLIGRPDDPSTSWVPWVPAVVVGVLTVVYWLARRKSWDWATELPVAVWLSVLAMPYGFWHCDHALLLIPIVQAAARLAARGTPLARWGLGLLYAAVAFEAFIGFRAVHDYGWAAALTFVLWAVAMWVTRDRAGDTPRSGETVPAR